MWNQSLVAYLACSRKIERKEEAIFGNWFKWEFMASCVWPKTQQKKVGNILRAFIFYLDMQIGWWLYLVQKFWKFLKMILFWIVSDFSAIIEQCFEIFN